MSLKNSMGCDGCELPLDPKADRLELKPLRGGVALNIKRGDGLKVVQFPATVDGKTETLHFHKADCVTAFLSRLVDAALKVAEKNGTEGTDGTDAKANTGGAAAK